MAADYVANNMTYENYEYAKQHATKENAEKAYEGGKWLNQKADEHNIDKWAVAKKVGSAIGKGASAAWNAASSVEYSKHYNNMTKGSENKPQ